MSPIDCRHAQATVRGMVLYGSQARGDADALSDTDVAVFAQAATPDSLIALKRRLGAGGDTSNYSVYSVATASQMAQEGSLFLWHLKLEGLVRFQRDGWLDWLWNSLAPYTRLKARQDLRTFDIAINDVIDGLRGSDTRVLFEASTTYSILRSVGMIACMALGRPSFSRQEPIRRVLAMADGSASRIESELPLLLEARLAYSRGSRSPDLTRPKCMAIAQDASQLISLLRSQLLRDGVPIASGS
jgi:hypothetical protein